jgi:hypothetical protein
MAGLSFRQAGFAAVEALSPAREGIRSLSMVISSRRHPTSTLPLRRRLMVAPFFFVRTQPIAWRIARMTRA